MRFNKVRKMDISNGPGVRVAVFFQGCPFHCPDCFNQETWDFNGGKDYTCDIENKILEFCGKEYINGLSILGGEPMAPSNIDTTIHLAKRFKDQNGSIICRELLQGVPTTDGVNPEPRTENYYKKRPCVELVGDSVEIFEQFLKESKSKV